MVTDVNSFFTLESMLTLTGATGATVIISNGVQNAFDFNPKWLALAIALIISIATVVFTGGKGSDYFIGIVNGFLIYATAVGANSVSGTDVGKAPEARGLATDAADVTKKRKFHTRWF